jgi:7-cyano-7-deazaguanine synthase in queuosine biosynthesis
MSKHTLICQLGRTKESIPILSKHDEVDELVIDPTKTSSEHGFNSTLKGLSELGLVPTEIAIDWLLVAMSVISSDTRINRSEEAQDNWTREIDLYIPVSEPDKWKKSSTLLSNTLRFLTGDSWRFIFRKRPNGYSHIAHKPKTKSPDDITDVCLFSGGLDSFIGATDLLSKGHKPILISHYNDPETSASQNRCVDAIKNEFGSGSFYIHKSGIGFPKNLFNDCNNEDTTRGRSFLFYSLAILAASALNNNTKIIIPENGLIALNAPLDTLRLGALSTRTAHPYFIARINQLSQSLGLNIKLSNPYRHDTKGEMIEKCKNYSFLEKNIALTMSCSDPKKMRWYGKPHQHCGYCLPCIIRQASIKRGLKTMNDPTPYGNDIHKKTLDSKKAEGINVRSFIVAINKLNKKPSMIKTLIHKPGPLTDNPSEIPLYEDLFKRGMNEVSELLKDVSVKPSK